MGTKSKIMLAIGIALIIYVVVGPLQILLSGDSGAIPGGAFDVSDRQGGRTTMAWILTLFGSAIGIVLILKAFGKLKGK